MAGAASGLVPDAGRTMSGIGNVLFKEREGGAREVDDPQAIQSQLGAGQSLDGGVKSQMESAFGESFSGVQVHTDANAAGLSDSLNARAFTVGEHVAFGAGEYKPGTLIGDALIAHELAHVLQQGSGGTSVNSKLNRAGTDSTLEEDADRSAVEAMLSLWGRDRMPFSKIASRTFPSLRAGLRLQRCKDRKPSPTSPSVEKFSELQKQWTTLSTPADRNAALTLAIAAARKRANLLYKSAGSNPILSIRQPIERSTKVDLEDNPLISVTQENVEQAYRAWAEGASVEPWVLLALWKKEGIGETVLDTIAATTGDRAKALYRSRIYYDRMGLDHFISYTSASGDNRASFTDSDAPLHDTAFRNAITAQVAAGRLPRDISGEINAELSATSSGPGHFQVTPTDRFFTLSLLLAGAYYRENVVALESDPRIGSNPDPGLVYMRWNMGATRFAPFIPSAESHRMESQYTMAGGMQPSITQWAFEREPRTAEWGQPRANAIRYRYFIEVFRLIYEGW
jgi:hypothetical protein